MWVISTGRFATLMPHETVALYGFMPKDVQPSFAHRTFGIKHRNVSETGAHGTILNQLWSLYFQEQKYVTHWFYSFFYLEAKFGPLKNKKYTIRLTSIEMKFFRRTAGTHFLTTQGTKKILEDLKAVPVDEKLRRYESNCL
jgi:hypothetical protein